MYKIQNVTPIKSLPGVTIKNFFWWLRTNSTILSGASALVGSTVVTSGLGFAYWWLAARLFIPSAVGFASAAQSAMLLLGTMSLFGLGTLLIRELPCRPNEQGALIMIAMLLAGGIGLVVGSIAALVAPLVAPDLHPLAAEPRHVLLFAMGVSVTAITLVIDHAAIGLFRSPLQLLRNTVFAIAKLGALLATGTLVSPSQGIALYATVIVANLCSLLPLMRFVWKSRPYVSYQSHWRLMSQIWRSALGHHALNLALQAPLLGLPIVVTSILSAATNARFAVAWLIASLLFIAPSALTNILYAVASAHPNMLIAKLRVTLGLSLCCGTAGVLVLMSGASVILGLFGPSYIGDAIMSLRILSLGVFPFVVQHHYVTLQRIAGNRIVGIACWMAAGAALELFFAIVGASLAGLPGLCAGWLCAMLIEGILMVPSVYRAAYPQTICVAMPALNTTTADIEQENILAA